MVSVELIYIAADQSVIHLKLDLAAGATVADAISESQLIKQYPEIEAYSVGIFAKPVTKDVLLQSGDRIEIYRPLIIDPKEKRRRLAKGKK